MPSRRAESKVGYDISIGCYNSNCRIRTMHKLVYRRWCDEEWTWCLSKFYRPDQISGDYRHLETLLENYKGHDHYPRLIPYLVLNVCYCIHDYRRMGANYKDWQIPPFDSLLRTIIVDLSAICQMDNWQNALQCPDFELVVSKCAPRQKKSESVQEYLRRISKKELFEIRIEPNGAQLKDCVLTFDELCCEIEKIATIGHESNLR